MPINRLLAESKLPSQDVERLSEAFNLALRGLCLIDRDDPVCEIVARRIIELGTDGTRDPKQIADLTVKQLGIP